MKIAYSHLVDHIQENPSMRMYLISISAWA